MVVRIRAILFLMVLLAGCAPQRFPAMPVLGILPTPKVAKPEHIAYDETNRVLFGGWGAESVLNDTWVWDGQDWTQLHPSNSPSEEASRFSNLAFDPVRQAIVLYTTIQIKNDRPEDFEAYSEIWTLS